MKGNRILWLGAVALGVALVLGVMSMRESPAPHIARNAEPNLFPFVRSFEGTRPDGEVRPGKDNTLTVDRELRNLFEYYLAAVGEQSLDAIRAEIERELDRRLSPSLAVQAKDLLSRYLDYKRALVEVEKNPSLAGNAIDAIRARLLALQQTRTQFFSDKEIEGMFGADDAYDNDAVARLEIYQDKSLSDAQKREKLAALDAALPKPLQEMRDATLLPVQLEQKAAAMRQQGASDDDVYRMRAASVGPEAANRLGDVDREQAEWKARIDAYLVERKRLLANSGSSDLSAALQQLRDARFTPDEQRRLAAYEQNS
ncbi:lipase secretion chaperone [Herbaspirillum sp. ST 5-3]|uniref:lipase secretion chaperone n=1 Tax=Oxalobacteraceae TaxID=75682 RepID=UPI0010A3B1B8|nr:lipase secretion chaperone [Herbaspirillum sp. ST 5-3]